ncbi:hypothetical protein ACWEF2_23400, partial [Streptosporangium sp. NPDC004631]
RQAVHFHLRNAQAWANKAVGEDLTAQIDPDFAFGPETTVTCHSAWRAHRRQGFLPTPHTIRACDGSS